MKNEDKQTILDYVSRNEMETAFLYANVIEFGVENNKEIGRCGDYFGYFHGSSFRIHRVSSPYPLTVGLIPWLSKRIAKRIIFRLPKAEAWVLICRNYFVIIIYFLKSLNPGFFRCEKNDEK
jgi:hypothetical protein